MRTPSLLLSEGGERELARRLREARDRAHLTQVEAGDAIGRDGSAITRIETAARSVSALELYALAALYDVPLAHFFERRAFWEAFLHPQRCVLGDHLIAPDVDMFLCAWCGTMLCRAHMGNPDAAPGDWIACPAHVALVARKEAAFREKRRLAQEHYRRTHPSSSEEGGTGGGPSPSSR